MTNNNKVMNTLIYCLDVLKIKEDTEVYRNAVELEERVSIESSNEWISGSIAFI